MPKEVSADARNIDFVPDGKVLTGYFLSDADFPFIIGPRNSAKSTGSVMKLYSNALNQWPASNGWIYRRSCIVRATYDELKRSAIKTWQMWFPEEVWGPVVMSHPPTHHIRMPWTGGGLDWEIVFLALDNDDAAKKVTSTEFSDAFLNEVWELGRDVISAIKACTNRYPNSKLSVGRCGACGAPGSGTLDCAACGGEETVRYVYRPQVLMDTNGPPMGHWLNYMTGLEATPAGLKAEERASYEKPAGWEVFIQPPGLLVRKDEEGAVVGYEENPEAENRKYRAPGYYLAAAAGAAPDFIQRYLVGRPGTASTGRGIVHQFREEVHEAREDMKLVPGLPVYAGMDFGRTPALVVGQHIGSVTWSIVGELDGIESSAREFMSTYGVPFINGLIEQVDPDGEWDWPITIYCDPAGDHHSEATDTTPIRELRALGLHVVRALQGQKFTVRRDTMNALMGRMHDGKPAFRVSPRCRSLIRALGGGYCYPRVTLPGGTVIVAERPDKRNPNTHIANACEYLITGHDKGAVVFSGSGRAETRMGGMSPRPEPYLKRVDRERRVMRFGKPAGFMARRAR